MSRVNTHVGPVNLRYSISKKTLKLKNKVYKTTDDPENPWTKGIYDIEIPDHPHDLGHKYPESQFAITWFRIGHDGKKYLHTGRISEGCVTIVETKKWDEICKLLIRARKGDGKSVGVLEVIA